MVLTGEVWASTKLSPKVTTFVKSCVLLVAKEMDEVLSDIREKHAKVFRNLLFYL